MTFGPIIFILQSGCDLLYFVVDEFVLEFLIGICMLCIKQVEQDAMPDVLSSYL